MTDPHPVSLLLRLPPEVRNEIYEYALGDTVDDFRSYYDTTTPRLALACTCRDMRVESQPLFQHHIRQAVKVSHLDVNNFSFDHATKFLAEYLRGLTKEPRKKRRTMIAVHLRLTDAGAVDFASLERELQFCHKQNAEVLLERCYFAEVVWSSYSLTDVLQVLRRLPHEENFDRAAIGDALIDAIGRRFEEVASRLE